MKILREWTIVAAVTCVAIGVLAVGLEVYFRTQTPFASISWPSRFDPQVGFIFTPGSEIRWTNNLDFWTVQPVNKWGFADREPVETPPAAGECRVAFIGDSFVEAAQVPVSQKVQTVIEELAARQTPPLKLTASAFGYSGTGQLNQLPFYDRFARTLKPRVVVLVFVSNDFANNSNVLEALRNGWDPDHTPRIFATRAGASSFALQPIDPDWSSKTLQSSSSAQQTSRSLWHGRFMQRSAFYRWLYLKISLLHPGIANFMAGTGGPINTTASYARQLRDLEGYRQILDDWNVESEPDIDEKFFSERMPNVFEAAVDYTGFALDEYLKRAQQDGFKLVLLAETGLSNSKLGDGQLKRLTKLAAERGIPVIDQRAYIATAGGDPAKVRFEHDGHWSPQGHRWAAEATLKLLSERPEFCQGAH